MFTGLKGSTALFDGIGDPNAFYLSRQHNDRLDYFGRSVNIAARIQDLAEEGEMFSSEDVYQAPGVHEALGDCIGTRQQVLMKGVSGSVQVYKVELNL